eukprot:Skav225163  [mRNA]  locus=scaffold1056:332893:341115:- [translate_table: standard]
MSTSAAAAAVAANASRDQPRRNSLGKLPVPKYFQSGNEHVGKLTWDSLKKWLSRGMERQVTSAWIAAEQPGKSEWNLHQVPVQLSSSPFKDGTLVVVCCANESLNPDVSGQLPPPFKLRPVQKQQASSDASVLGGKMWKSARSRVLATVAFSQPGAIFGRRLSNESERSSVTSTTGREIREAVPNHSRHSKSTKGAEVAETSVQLPLKPAIKEGKGSETKTIKGVRTEGAKPPGKAKPRLKFEGHEEDAMAMDIPSECSDPIDGFNAPVKPWLLSCGPGKVMQRTAMATNWSQSDAEVTLKFDLDSSVGKEQLKVKIDTAHLSVTGRIAEGRFGTVFAAFHRVTGKKVAVKKIRARRNLPGLDFDPWAKSAERERDVLTTVKHDNIIELLEHLVEPDAAMAVLIYPYLAWDVATVLEKKRPLSDGIVKCLMQMLLEGVSFLHRHSCRFSEAEGDHLMTRDVCTRWYKAPEMLFGSVTYSLGVDLWAVGCTFADFLSPSDALFPGGSDLEQLCLIFQALGTPDEDDWPEVRDLPDYPKVSFAKRLPKLPVIEMQNPAESEACADLLWAFLRLNPKRRISAAEALLQKFFQGVISSPEAVVEGLPECGHHQAEANEGPISPFGLSEFGSDCSLLSMSGELQPVTVAIAGRSVFSQELCGKVNVDESDWQIEVGASKTLVVNLCKKKAVKWRALTKEEEQSMPGADVMDDNFDVMQLEHDDDDPERAGDLGNWMKY